MLLIPGARPVSVRTASVPLPLTPGIAPTSESAVEAMVPPTLSMVPGRKNVAPPPGRNEPSVMEAAETVPGSKLRSNWKAYRSVTAEIVTSRLMLLPALTVDGEGATLKVGIPSAKDGNEKIGAKNNPAIIKAILIRCMFFSFFLNHNQALLTDRTCGDLLGHYRKIKNVYHPI